MKSELSSPILTHERVEAAQARPAVVGVGTRVASLLTLLCVLVLMGYALSLAYRAVSDSYIAPLILSPDNDLVLAHKQKVLELDVQKSLATAQAEGLDADLSATATAESRLMELYSVASGSVRYSSDVNSTQVSAGTQEIEHLNEQRKVLEDLQHKQAEITERAAANFRAGLTTRGDYDRETQALRQAELQLLENSRAIASAEAKLSETMLGKSSIERRTAAMPAMVSRESQMVQVQLELLRLQAEKRSKRAQRTVLTEQIERIESLQSHLKSRPIFLAMERSLYAAFVPYTQMDDVKADANVVRCKAGFFFCRKVGRVAEVVPGEVTAPDPWGNPARGQYVLLDLDDQSAATSKVLRVRPAGKVGLL